MKPSDCWAVPLCHGHHVELHNKGERPFDDWHGLDLRAAALWFAKRSPDAEVREKVAEHE